MKFHPPKLRVVCEALGVRSHEGLTPISVKIDTYTGPTQPQLWPVLAQQLQAFTGMSLRLPNCDWSRGQGPRRKGKGKGQRPTKAEGTTASPPPPPDPPAGAARQLSLSAKKHTKPFAFFLHLMGAGPR